jgi:hypothetical protein
MSRDQEWWETQDGDDAWQHQQMQEALRREEEERAEQEIKDLEDSLRSWDEEHDEGALFADGFDAALIGVGVQFSREVAIYDYDKCLDILIERDNMDIEEAIDYMEYNVVGAYAGKSTPVFLIREQPHQDDVSNLNYTEPQPEQTKQKKQITVQLEFNF